MSSELSVMGKALEIIMDNQKKLEEENQSLKKLVVDFQSTRNSGDHKNTEELIEEGSLNGISVLQSDRFTRNPVEHAELERSNSVLLMKLVEQWDISRDNMFNSLEGLLDMGGDDTVKIGTIRRYVAEKKKTLSQRLSIEELKKLAESLESGENGKVDVDQVNSVINSLLHNLDIKREPVPEVEEKLEKLKIVKMPSIVEECLIGGNKNREETLPKGLRMSINSLRNMQGYLKLSTGDPLLVRKLGNYWRGTDEYTYVMITKMLCHTLTNNELMQFLRTQLQGRYNLIKTSFGHKLRLYADYTASGQELLIFNHILESIIENYANTHTEASYDGKFMNKLFHEAELKILKACNANPQHHSVLPVGTGATGGIEFVQKIIGTYIPPKTVKVISNIMCFNELKASLREKKELPLILLTAYEHHSNEITWRNQLCDIKVIQLTQDGYLDYDALDRVLTKNQEAYKKIICSFSAGSNVTGIKTDIDRAVSLAKKYGALIFFDYAGAGPYVKIDLSKDIDGVYLSPHKFLGGPGSCGIAIIKNRIYDLGLAPSHGGGGTVDFVNSKTAIFSNDIMSREKSGTPGILQIIKAGLAFDLKTQIFSYLTKRESELIHRFFKRFTDDHRIYIIGPLNPENRVPIVSFNIRHSGPQGLRILHPVFVVRLLSDLFGIQGRGGCSCAGPYGHRLLHINKEMSEQFMKWVMPLAEDTKSFGGIKLGWARINLHYSFSDEELDYIMSAIDFIADYGHMFLPYYVFDPISGNWQHLCEEQIEGETLSWKLLQTSKLYAKDEACRSQLFKRQLEEAKNLTRYLSDEFEVDSLVPWGDLAFFYVAKGNLQNADEMDQRKCSLNKAN